MRIRDDQLVEVALAYDADCMRVRAEVAEWLDGISAFAAGLAAGLMRRDRTNIFVPRGGRERA